jgi:hypothetical protein
MRISLFLSLLVASTLIAQEPVVIRPTEISDVLTNPGIGFTTLQRFNGDPLNEGTKWTEGSEVADRPGETGLHRTLDAACARAWQPL